jgi:hypothetical protein
MMRRIEAPGQRYALLVALALAIGRGPAGPSGNATGASDRHFRLPTRGKSPEAMKAA